MGTNINRGIDRVMGAATKIDKNQAGTYTETDTRHAETGTGADKYIDRHTDKKHTPRKKQKKEQRP